MARVLTAELGITYLSYIRVIEEIIKHRGDWRGARIEKKGEDQVGLYTSSRTNQ